MSEKRGHFLVPIDRGGFTTCGSLEAIQHFAWSSNKNSAPVRVGILSGLSHFELRDLGGAKASVPGRETPLANALIKETRTTSWRQR